MSRESFAVDLTVPDGWCGHCRRELREDEHRLIVEARIYGEVVKFVACDSCLSEYAPGLRDAITGDATRGISFEGPG